MKISSASKKVLASALSAAMVVAFAPTAAFGAIAKDTKVKVSFDENGGTYTDGGLNPIDAVVGEDDALVITGAVAGGAKYQKGEAAFDFWFYDANNNGTRDTNEPKVGTNNDTLDVSSLDAKTSAITLKASYKELKAEASAEFNTAATDYKASDNSTVTVKATNLKAGIYRAVATVGGTQYQSDAVTVDESEETFEISVPNSKFAAGDIATYVETDSDRVKVTGTDATTSIYTITCKPGEYGVYQDGSATKTYLVAKGIATTALDNLEDPQSSYGFEDWALDDGTDLSTLNYEGALVGSDMTFVAQYANPKVRTVVFNTDDEGNYKLAYVATNLPDSDDNSNLEGYKVTILAGSDVLTSYELKLSSLRNNNFDGILTFGADYTTDATTSAAAAAGTYTVKFEAKYKEGTTGNEAIAIEKSVTVDAIVLDANGGKAPSAKYNGPKAPTLIQAGKTLEDVTFTTGSDYGYTNADDTLEFDGWSVDGTKAADASKVVAPADGSAITLKALWKAYKVAAPTLVSAVEDSNGTYTLTFASTTDGAKLTYEIDEVGGTVPATGLAGVAATAEVDVTASASNLTKSDDVEFYGYKSVDYDSEASPLEGFDDFANGILTSETADDQTPKPVYYNSVEAVKAAVEAGETAIKAQGFATEEQCDKVILEQEKAVGKAVVDYAKTQLEALRTLTKSADGKTYSKLSDSNYKLCVMALDSSFKKCFGEDEEESGYGIKEAVGPEDIVYFVQLVISNAELFAAANTFDAADVDAAQTVTASLQAAKDATAAAAAVEAYNALTDDQKELVAAADVVAANKVVIDANAAEAKQAKEDADQAKKDAEQKGSEAEQAKSEAADAYDLAAASQLAGKTVTAKAKAGKNAKGKKFSFKLAASKSGNVATFIKTGSKYISVSAAGKVTFKKVKAAKKAKTYKAKVTVTFGTQTKTVTVKYVVAGK